MYIRIKNGIQKTILILLIIILAASFYACRDKEYTVSFVSFGEEISVLKHKGRGEIVLPQPTQEGYTFLGWFLDEEEWQNPFTEVYFFEKKIDKNYTVYAKWQAKEYVKVSFETFTDQKFSTIVIEKGKKTSFPTPQREGYTFLGWCHNEFLNSIFDSDTAINKDILLRAKWLSDTPINNQNYTVTLLGGENIKTYLVGYGQKLSIPKTRRIGYKLEGYYVDEKYTIAYDMDLAVTSSFTLYSVWYIIEEDFKVSFQTNGGEYLAPLMVKYDELITPPIVQMEGYLFVDWYVDNNLTRLFDFQTTGITADTILYAKWQKDGVEEEDTGTFYIITYVHNGGSGINSTKAYIGQPPSLDVPIKEPDIFGGWYFDTDFNVPYVYDENNKRDFILYAKWNHSVQSGEYTFIESSGGIKITKYIGTNTEITLPNKVDNKNVVEIGEGAFESNEIITKVIFNENITHIGNNAFKSCTSLSELVGYNSIIEIGEEAFYRTKISTLSFGAQLNKIGAKAFLESDLTEITVLGDFTMGESAFENCALLETVVMNDIQSIEQKTFFECKKLATLSLNSCKEIKHGAFSGCKNLTSVSLPECIALSGEAFAGCGIVSITLPKVETMQDRALFSTAITQISLPNIQMLGTWSLADCSNLTQVNIGANLTILGSDGDVFAGSNQIVIAVDSANIKFSSHNGSLLNKEGTMLLCVGGINNLSYTVPSTVTEINMYAFTAGEKIKTLTIGAAVADVGFSLSMIKDLESVNVETGNLAYKIVDGHLYKMDNALVRYMPKSEETEFTVREETTAIYSGAFAHCSNLTKVRLNSLTTVNFGAFYQCYSLEEVENSEHVQVFEDFCFYECSNLESIVFGENVLSIGVDSFGETKVTNMPLDKIVED